MINYLDAAVGGEAAHHGGVLDVHPLEDALRQLPVLGRLLMGGVSDNQANKKEAGGIPLFQAIKDGSFRVTTHISYSRHQ